jgi:hypothetical protein
MTARPQHELTHKKERLGTHLVKRGLLDQGGLFRCDVTLSLFRVSGRLGRLSSVDGLRLEALSFPLNHSCSGTILRERAQNREEEAEAVEGGQTSAAYTCGKPANVISNTVYTSSGFTHSCSESPAERRGNGA